VLGRDADARVPHAHSHPAVGRLRLHPDAPTCGRELDTIDQEVHEDLLEPDAVAPDDQARRHIRLEGHALLPCRDREHTGCVPDHVAQVEVLAGEERPVGVELRYVQEVPEERGHAPEIANGGVEQLVLRRGEPGGNGPLQ
jgi:hypothetical protein